MKNKSLIYGSCWVLLILAASAWAAGSPPGVSTDMEKLGMHLYKDKNLSLYQNQSCQTCHHPFAGFADRTNFLDPYNKVVSTGSDGVSKGGRNAPSSAYAGYSPILTLNESGEWVGGLFWDGRADGSVLGDPLAEQAQGPPLNPVEMAMPDKAAVIDVIQSSTYVNLWYKVFGSNSLSDVDTAFDNFAVAVAAYERSADVTKFTSKFDIAAGQFTAAEERGLALFEIHCASCHSTAADFGAPAALFTNYQYANIGAPANPLVPLDNPDLGIGAIVDDPGQDGKFKVPTLRNIVMTRPYSHNGSFPTLREMVSFINDRTGFEPEVDRNIDERVGTLGMSESEIDDLVAFLHTLTDDY